MTGQPLDSIWRVPENSDLLKKLWNDGHSASEIAARIPGASRNALIGRVHRLGLTGRATLVRQPHRGGTPKRRAARTEAGVIRRISSKVRAENDPHKFEAEVAVDLPADQSADAVAFLERKRSQCCWPLNSVTPIYEHMACGSKCDGEHSYCPRHHRLSVQTSRRRLPELTDDERARRALQARRNLAAHKERLVQA